MDLANSAATAEKVVEGIMKVEPMVATGVGMFVPGAAPIIAVVQPAVAMAAPFVEQALTSLAKNNGGDAFAAFIALLQHLTPGQPNASILDTKASSLPQAS